MESNEARVQFLEKNHTEVERIDYVEITLDECKQLPFWCNRLVGDCKCCISHLAGMPEHPDTLQQMKFTPYQLEFIDIIDTSENNKFHVNKPRQSGFSEIVLRIFQDRGFKKYSTKSCKYVVGTREKTTKKMIRRLKQLYKKIPDVIENNSDSLYLELKDGTSFEGLPANPEAITGDTKIAAIAMDESAKWNRIDDQEVLDAYIPIVRTNHSDLFMFSTPKGPRGFQNPKCIKDGDAIPISTRRDIEDACNLTKEQKEIQAYKIKYFNKHIKPAIKEHGKEKELVTGTTKCLTVSEFVDVLSKKKKPVIADRQRLQETILIPCVEHGFLEKFPDPDNKSRDVYTIAERFLDNDANVESTLIDTSTLDDSCVKSFVEKYLEQRFNQGELELVDSDGQNITPIDLIDILCKIDAQTPKNRHEIGSNEASMSNENEILPIPATEEIQN